MAEAEALEQVFVQAWQCRVLVDRVFPDGGHDSVRNNVKPTNEHYTFNYFQRARVRGRCRVRLRFSLSLGA